MRKLTLRMAILTALLPASAYPLGLGEIDLKSALNQDLNAEIEVLSAEPEDAEQLIVKMASREAFARAGIDRPYMLQQIKFKTVVKKGKPYIEVYSKKPIREPFISFLLEIDWPEGHLLREYTMLLDPPVYATSSSRSTTADSGRPFIDPADRASGAQSATPSAPAAAPAQYASSAPVSQQTQAATQAAPVAVQPTYQAAAPSYPASDNYRVQANDTLWSLANRMRPDTGVSVEQMMLALVRENPESFIKENINGLKRGYILRIPDRSQIVTIDRQQALAEVRKHANLWREYRQAMSGVAPASAMEADANVDVVDGKAGASDVEGQLSIVSAGEKGGDQAGTAQDPEAEIQKLRQQLAMAQEALESKNLENNELSGRLAELEERVAGVLQMNDGELAKLQEDLKDTQVAGTEAPQAETPADATEETAPPAGDEVTEPAPSADNAEAAANETPAAGEEAAPEDETEVQVTDETAVFVDENGDTAVVETEVVEPVVPAQPEPAPAPAFAQNKPKSFIENLLNDPKMLGIIGGASVLVLALIALLIRRRRVNKEEEEWTSESGDFSLDDIADTATENMQTEAMDAVNPDDTSKMMVDQDASSDELPDDPMLDEFDESILEEPEQGDHEDTVISLDGGPEAESEEDERDDVIAEADVYLAYGIYQQAEELLKNAIEQNPDRDDYRMKLLETYFAGKNADAFADLAEDVHSRKGDDKSYWDRVLVMGKELCPGNELFSGNAPILPDFDSDDLLPQKPETTDLELDADEGTDLDLGLGDDNDATQILSEPVDLEAMGGATSTDESDDLDLGADLDEMLTEGSDETTAEDAQDLEFDLGDFGDELEASEAETDSDSSTEELSLDIEDDFSLDFEASDLGLEADEDETESPELETAETDTDTDELSLDEDLDLSIGLDESETEELQIDEEEAELEIDLPDDAEMDLEADLDSEPAADDTGLHTAVMDEVSLDDDEDDDFDISELSEDVDEVSTKLDLARAYIDMGDNEGAISILQEVKQEGNDEQQKEADELIAKAS